MKLDLGATMNSTSGKYIETRHAVIMRFTANYTEVVLKFNYLPIRTHHFCVWAHRHPYWCTQTQK